MAGAASAIGTLGGVDEVQKLLNGGPLVATEG
jgi:hypothetical protein